MKNRKVRKTMKKRIVSLVLAAILLLGLLTVPASAATPKNVYDYLKQLASGGSYDSDLQCYYVSMPIDESNGIYYGIYYMQSSKNIEISIFSSSVEVTLVVTSAAKLPYTAYIMVYDSQYTTGKVQVKANYNGGSYSSFSSFSGNTSLKADMLSAFNQLLPTVLEFTRAIIYDGKGYTLKDMGLNEISLGVESGDDWTLDRINKGYHAADILEQCAKLDEAGVAYWMTFLNGVAGQEHSAEHALHSAEIFSQCHPMVVGTGGLTLFPGTPLLEEAERGEFTPLTEKEMLIELKTFVEHLSCDCSFITHHTISGTNLTGSDFLGRKEKIVAALQNTIEHGDLDRMAAIRRNKRTL